MRPLFWSPEFDEELTNLKTQHERLIVKAATDAYDDGRLELKPLTDDTDNDGLWYLPAAPFMLIVGDDGKDLELIGIERRYW